MNTAIQTACNTTLQKPDYISTIIREGFEVRANKISCPFHFPDKNPSFVVYPKAQTGHCFGCGWHGDIIAFIMQYKNLSFKDVLVYLGIATCKLPKPNIKEIKKRELVKGFKKWCDSHYGDLCEFYRLWNDVKAGIKTIKKAEKYSLFYHREPVITYHMDILCSNDDEAKFGLFREVMSYANGN